MSNPQNKLTEKCAICLNDSKNSAKINSCFHFFCYRCIFTWSQTENTCPVCKKRFNKIIKKYPKKINKSIKKAQIHEKHKSREIIEVRVEEKDQQTWEDEFQFHLFDLLGGRATRSEECKMLQFYSIIEDMISE